MPVAAVTSSKIAGFVTPAATGAGTTVSVVGDGDLEQAATTAALAESKATPSQIARRRDKIRARMVSGAELRSNSRRGRTYSSLYVDWPSIDWAASRLCPGRSRLKKPVAAIRVNPQPRV